MVPSNVLKQKIEKSKVRAASSLFNFPKYVALFAAH